MREAVKVHPPYVVPCIDMAFATVDDDDETFLHAITHMQFPILQAGKPFTGERATIPGIEYPRGEKDWWVQRCRKIWKYCQTHPDGPVDHALPMLTVTSAAGKLRALFLNYACHGTTYGPEFNKIHGDWPGVAAQMIEAKHPGCVAIVALGCGGDANPEPRGATKGFEMVNRHGAAVAREVVRLLNNTNMISLKTAPTCRCKRITLPLDHVPDRAELQQRLNRGPNAAYFARTLIGRLGRGETIPASFSYPVQVWRFGDDPSMVFLAGEVVSGYSPRLKREADNQHPWVNAYSNDDPCYIPTRKMILEGGYEVVQSMDSFAKASHLSPRVEDMIIEAVQSLPR